MNRTVMLMRTETRKSGRKRTGMRYNRYGDDFLIDKIRPEELGEGMVNMGDLVADEEWQIINNSEQTWQKGPHLIREGRSPRTQ